MTAVKTELTQTPAQRVTHVPASDLPASTTAEALRYLRDLIATLEPSVGDDSITFAKLQNIATDSLIGRDTASSGDPEEIAVGGGLEFTGTGGIQRSALTGDVAASAGSNSTTIGNNSVSNAKLRDSAALSVVGRSAGTSGDPADIVATTDQVLRESGGALGFGTVATGGIANDAVTFAKLQNIATDRLIGRDTASSGDPEEIAVGGGLEFTGSAGIQRSALTGDVTASAGSNSTSIANNAVTYAKMQDVSATSRIIGRKTASSGDPEECTLSEVLDFIGSAAQGDILYRGASGWARLAAGTVRQYLKTGGSGANPSWGDISMKVGTFTRDLSTASGSQAVTGVGFTPKVVFFLSSRNSGGWGSVGVDDGTSRGAVEWNGDYTANAPCFSQTAQFVRQTSANYQSYTISSLDSNGFTLSFTKTGTPTGTLQAVYLAIG